jgi:predicted nucleotidyltransferase
MARTLVLRLLDAVRDEPFEIFVIGSLANGRFALHSDVDLLVRGSIDTRIRVHVEQQVAAAFRGSGIPYDLIFVCDLTPARLQEFEHDLVEPSRLREVWAEADAGAAGNRQPG